MGWKSVAHIELLMQLPKTLMIWINLSLTVYGEIVSWRQISTWVFMWFSGSYTRWKTTKNYWNITQNLLGNFHVWMIFYVRKILIYVCIYTYGLFH